ncbi:MAG: hypothetical protein WAU01_02430 [Saprospiraceae bacterium]
MFGKVKKILGIEGVKLELIVPEKINKDIGMLQGVIRLTSLSDDNETIGIKVKMIEKYTRGRGDAKLINEYPMGELVKKERVNISKNEVVEIPFELEFVYVKSEMDKMAESNFMSRGLVALAKKARGVKSTYTVTAEVTIKGTTLHPFDTKPLILE